MADFSAKNYQAFCKEETNAVENLKARVADIREGSKILVSVPALRDNFWKTVASVEKFDACMARVKTTDGKEHWCDDILIVTNSKSAETRLICLNDRRREFTDALSRADSSNLDVFPDFEKDKFVVVNRDNGNEYRITLRTGGERILVGCECEDFRRRCRVCKHISVTLRDILWNFLAAFSEPVAELGR